MKSALLRFTKPKAWRSGSGLLTGIALVMLALVAVPIGVAAEAADKSSPTNQFLTAYNSMSLADWLKEKDMPAEAADLYIEALELFGKLAADYPQWQPAVVSFRITYCRDALQRLQGSVERKAPTDRAKSAASDGLVPPAAGRQTTRDADARQTTDLSRVARDDGKSAIGNQKSEIRNLSPLNFKLQQAALRERGRDYTGALVMYIALLEEYPQELWALKGACRCYLRLERMNMARALIRQALALPAPDADMYLLAALMDCYDGRYQTAINLLRQSLKQNGACPEAHTALGVALAAIGQTKEAQEEMKRALSFNPKLGDAYYNLARLSLRQKPNDRDTARVHYQNALRHGAAPDPKLDKLLAE